MSTLAIPVTQPDWEAPAHVAVTHTVEIKVVKVGNNWRIRYLVDGVPSRKVVAHCGDTVEWICANVWNVDFFQSTPFGARNFWGDAGAKHGGQIRADVQVGTYKYTVSVLINDDGQPRIITDDPEVDVDED